MGIKTMIAKTSVLLTIGIMLVNMGMEQVTGGDILTGALFIIGGGTCIAVSALTGYAPMEKAGMLR